MVNYPALDVSSVPKELLLLLAMLKENNDDEILSMIDDVDWALFAELVIHHRLYPTLHAVLEKRSFELVPDNVAFHIQQAYQENLFRMLPLAAELVQLSSLFYEAKIPFISLKGPVVGLDLYGELALRTSNDIDALVRIRDLDRVHSLLVERGYEKEEEIESVLHDWRWRHHHLTYIHHERQTKLEVHWRLHPGPGREPSFQELWDRKRISPLGETVYSLSKEDLFHFLIVHGARHGWFRLRWLYDVHQIVEQDVDWSLVAQLVKRNQLEKQVAQAIRLATELLGTKPHRPLFPYLYHPSATKTAQGAVRYFERMVSPHVSNRPGSIEVYHRKEQLQLLSFRKKCWLYVSYLHPYAEDAKTLPLPTVLHPLYFPLRPLLWTWRRMKKPVLTQGESG